MLPRLEGPQLLHRLRQEAGSEVPVIMLTARGELPDKIAGFRASADDYLTKPFERAELEARLEALAARGSGRARCCARTSTICAGRSMHPLRSSCCIPCPASAIASLRPA